MNNENGYRLGAYLQEAPERDTGSSSQAALPCCVAVPMPWFNGGLVQHSLYQLAREQASAMVQARRRQRRLLPPFGVYQWN